MAARDDIKYRPGVGPRKEGSLRPLTGLERITLIHAAVFAIAATWAFGGNAEWVRIPLAWWGSLSVLITLGSLQGRDGWREGALRTLSWLWPLVGFNVLVIMGTFNPGFREATLEGETLYISSGSRAGWPSAALPGRALRALWLFDAIWLTCFNLAVTVRQRKGLRALLLVLVANALVLAVFGTVQKLSGATGLFFDAVPSPQQHFFASFIYHNHWGAFVILMLAAGLGLTWHHARRGKARDALHSPAFAGLTVLVLLAITAPLSASRSASLAAGGLLCAAFLHWIVALARKRRQYRESIALPVAGAAAALLLATAAVWFVARDTIALRIDKTREQLADMRARRTIGDRATLYTNTWRMAREKPWFGWGMGSYPHVFTLYNTRQSPDGLPVFYHDAHSDWLQALAEHGFIGSALLAACALVPLSGIGPRNIRSTISRYLLAGCGLILLYAWIEFPFGNVAVVLHWWLCFFVALQYARLAGRSGGTG